MPNRRSLFGVTSAFAPISRLASHSLAHYNGLDVFKIQFSIIWRYGAEAGRSLCKQSLRKDDVDFEVATRCRSQPGR